MYRYFDCVACAVLEQQPFILCMQVRAAKLLSQLYVQRSQFDAAAAVQEALASRGSGDGATEAVSLSQRLECMEDAVLQASSLLMCCLLFWCIQVKLASVKGPRIRF